MSRELKWLIVRNLPWTVEKSNFLGLIFFGESKCSYLKEELISYFSKFGKVGPIKLPYVRTSFSFIKKHKTCL